MRTNRSGRCGVTVLGRSLSHENSACLLRDGELVAAVAAERLTRRKYDHSSNDLAVRYCLDAGQIGLDDVDVIVQSSPKHFFRAGNESAIIRDGDARVWTISHHLAHAWAAYATGPFDDATIVVIDGRGSFVPPTGDVVIGPGTNMPWADDVSGETWEIEVESIYAARGGRLHLLDRRRNRGLPMSIGARFSRRDGLFPDEYSGYYQCAGLGAMYEQACHGIFGANLDGGKVMGLAAYGTPDPVLMERMLQVDDNGYWLGTDWLFDLGGPAPAETDLVRAAQIAATVQAALESGVESVMARARRLGGPDRLCYTGGVALNGLANERIFQSRLFEGIFVQPACNDAGTSLGCAYFGHAIVRGETLSHQRYRDFTGIEHASSVHSAIGRWRALVTATVAPDRAAAAAALLLAGRIVAWYQGRSELGPRALGHRSILALPYPESVRSRLNVMVKRREGFRPFAPAVPLEAASKFFEIEGESPYMLRIVRVRPEYRTALAAVTHVDGTARVQTVREEDDPLFHRLLHLVGNACGVPVLLNTSFNTSGFPIVETPEDALRSFNASRVDVMFLEGYLVERRYGSAQEVLATPTVARWVLAPGVHIERVWRPGADRIVLGKGPRRREVSATVADWLMLLGDMPTAATQLAAAQDPTTIADTIEELQREGWVHATEVDTTNESPA